MEMTVSPTASATVGLVGLVDRGGELELAGGVAGGDCEAGDAGLAVHEDVGDLVLGPGPRALVVGDRVGACRRRRVCHSDDAPPVPLSGVFNRDGEW